MARPETLLEKLSAYCPGTVPMHMPGHKRHTALAPYLKKLAADLDITEIGGFDDLHAPEGVLLRSMERAARLWGAEHTFFSVNGSTGGVLAAVFAALGEGDRVLCARNCHRSVYHTLSLRRARVEYLYGEAEPLTGSACLLTPQRVEAALEKWPDARAVIVTSPSYEGVALDLAAIAEVVRKSGALLIVDEAHGAHLGFHPAFPQGAVAAGADLTVQSLHKTLPSLTQTAVLHIQGERVSPDAVQRALDVFETSSPSYLLLASIDGCVDLLEREGEALFKRWAEALAEFSASLRLAKLTRLQGVPAGFALDPSKLLFSTRGTDCTGPGLLELLRQSGVECEMAGPDYVLAMTGLGDTPENLTALARALTETEKRIRRLPAPCGGGLGEKRPPLTLPGTEKCLETWEAEALPAEAVPLDRATGRVAAETIWTYPPGIPLLLPGEQVPEGLPELLASLTAHGVRTRKSRSAERNEIQCAIVTAYR